MSHLDLRREDHAYFYGFFQTDGHLSSGVGRKGHASIELAVLDEPVLAAFQDLFPQVYSSVTRRTRDTNFATDYTSATWTVSALSFRMELVALGMPVGRKSDICRPPVPPFDVRGYLRGLVDGDGSVGFTSSGAPFISFVTASQPLAEFFSQQVFAVTGVKRASNRNMRDGVFGFMVANDPAASLAGWLYPRHCLAVGRKSQAALQVAKWTRPASMRARPIKGRRPWTPTEDGIVIHGSVREAAQLVGRTEQAVITRRWRLRNETG